MMAPAKYAYIIENSNKYIMFGNEITYCADKFQFNKFLHSVIITAIF